MITHYRGLYSPLHQFRSEMDRLLTGFLGPAADGLLPPLLGNQPAVNCWETDGAVMVEMEVPGLKKEHLDLSVSGGELTMKIDRPDLVQEGVVYHRRERPVGAISRVLQLPVEVDANRVEAELHDGVLTLHLPKAESVKPRKIKVNVK